MFILWFPFYIFEKEMNNKSLNNIIAFVEIFYLF